MTLPTKILLALVVALAGTAFADVTATNEDLTKFAPAPPPAETIGDSQAALTVTDEKMADNQTDAGTCQLACHPARAAVPTALHHLPLPNSQ
jgi:hypothetical protein